MWHTWHVWIWASSMWERLWRLGRNTQPVVPDVDYEEDG
jgi:hypothetical protein